MAMGLWQARAAKLGGDWRIGSAGTWTRGGDPASRFARDVMGVEGIDLSAHRSRVVTRSILSAHRLILTMEAGHKEALRAEFSDLAKRIFLLTEMIGARHDIVDPYGGSLAEYQETARELGMILDRGQARIIELSTEVEGAG
jgi:protein-tyrosine phosphatase